MRHSCVFMHIRVAPQANMLSGMSVFVVGVWRCLSSHLAGALLADAFHHIFGLFPLEAGGEGNGGNVDIGEAIGAVAYATGEVDMALAVARVVEMADAIFLRSGAVVDFMEQVFLGEERQHAEQCGAVDGGQGGFKVCQIERIAEVVAHFLPDEHAHGSDADARVHKGLFVGNVYMHGVRCKTLPNPPCLGREK